MTRFAVRFLFSCFLLGVFVCSARSIEAKPQEETRPKGVELWLDASDLAIAGTQTKGPTPVARWKDHSRHHREAIQNDLAKQPKFVEVGDSRVVRFDGEDDHLRILGLNRKLTDFTLFVVAAPHSNLGMFRGLFAFNQTDRRDYESGFTFDLNAPFSARVDNLNLEGRGFGGARNLLKTPVPFGAFHLFECSVDANAKIVRLAIDGQPQLDRPFTPSELVMDEITIGGRFYSNEPNQPQRVQGFFHGDVAEIILCNCILDERDTNDIRSLLLRKCAVLQNDFSRGMKLQAENSESLVVVTNPPPVQMLVPGFSVFELPVELKNINNVRYRADGKMYALGYNGDVWLVSDADGDGFEETATKFFENNKGSLRGPIGMAVIPKGHTLLNPDEPKSQGVIVPSKGKVTAILDHDGDDIADEERVIASGWKEITQSVDAVGCVIGGDGSIYFGLGTAAYDNAYLIDKEGKSHYDLESDNGTIQRIFPDLSRRERICTGVRFTIGMAMHQGLFVTDQEGATWLPNGNPFDELLHIHRDRHYGFPPQHPRHLPDVTDKPSLFDYGPQHQSTCGMAFNDPRSFSLDGTEGVVHEPLFGPKNWEGNLFVTGESRGKLYRTEIVQVVGGYVARNHLIACLSMLTIDCCLSPTGDLVVACHSGGPDWGSGPNGQGKLFKIRYSNRTLPQPMAAWAANSREVRIAFDRPLDPAHLRDLAKEAKITYGAYVAAGDRFESIWPGYAVVQMQKSAPRYNLPIHSISVLPDRKTLVIATAEHPVAWQYALTLPGMGRDETELVPKELPQHSQIDLAYSLNGVSATWEPDDPSQPGWSGWLPHIDLEVVNALSSGDSGDDQFWSVVQKPGTLTMETKIDVRDLVHPAVHPGSKLDHEWPEEPIEFHFGTNRPLTLEANGKILSTKITEEPFILRASSKTSEPVRMRLRMTTGNELPMVQFWRPGPVRNHGFEPLPLNRLILPWAETRLSTDKPVRQAIPELADGSWGRGRRVFFSEEAGCAKCHVAQGDAGRIGPDLSNLIHRDYASVLRDVTLPSFALNPDFLSSILTLKDGRILTGAIRSNGDKLFVGDKEGKIHEIQRADVDEIKHSSVSVMPEGIPKKLGPDRMRDLLTYLLTAPPQMPLESPLPPPKPRTRGEVAKILAGSAATHPPQKNINILLVAGAKDHGPGEHDYPAWLFSWSELLRGADGITLQTAMEWPTSEQISAADTIAFFQKGSWTTERAKAIDAHLAKGGGLAYIHWAVEAGSEAPAFAQRIGLASNAAGLKYRHGPLDLGFETGKDHPIGRNFDSVHFHDESYWKMQGDASRIRVVATGIEEGTSQPLFWTLESGRGKVFVSILGHYSWTFDDPLFRILLLRGIAWTANESVDRFNELATIGVKLAD